MQEEFRQTPRYRDKVFCSLGRPQRRHLVLRLVNSQRMSGNGGRRTAASGIFMLKQNEEASTLVRVTASRIEGL